MYNITQDDYKFIERPEDTMYTVELLTSAYAGTKYQYSKVSAKVNEDEENATLSFLWTLVEGDEGLTESADFQNYIGDVLAHILQDAFDTGEYKIGNDDDSKRTNDDPAEPSNE